jgi:predicted TIM-barrel fold metal-dependent hydrolase
VASLSGYGLSFDICVLARQLPIAIKLISKCPDVTFILDHCGVPQVKEQNLDPWRTHITEIANFPNVVCKISGVVAYADPKTWTAEDLRPFVEHAIASFGWDRVLFGSDWPVCTLSASFRAWVEALQAITRNAGEANQNKLFHDNAVGVYHLI